MIPYVVSDAKQVPSLSVTPRIFVFVNISTSYNRGLAKQRSDISTHHNNIAVGIAGDWHHIIRDSLDSNTKASVVSVMLKFRSKPESNGHSLFQFETCISNFSH